MSHLRKIRAYLAEVESEIERAFREMEEKFERFWHMENFLEPLTNVLVTPNEVIVTADAPCCDPSSVRVRPLENRIEILARTRKVVRFMDLGINRRGEFSFYKTEVEIPVKVDFSTMKVQVRRGFIEIRISRRL